MKRFFEWLLGPDVVPKGACYMCLHNPTDDSKDTGLCEGCAEQ
jgi:hypothetical protein